MDLSGISVTVDDCLAAFCPWQNVWKRDVSIGHSHATKSEFRATRSIHFTLNVQ